MTFQKRVRESTALWIGEVEATNVDETTCTFIVDPLDHTAFGPKTVRTFRNKYGYIAVTAFGFMLFQNEIKDSLKDFMDSLKKDEGTTPRYEDFINRTKDRTNSLPLVSSNQAPTETDSTSRSGTYKGYATEWNNTGEVTQDVKSTLVFNDDGSVKESGLDALDGPYTIAGKWRIINGVDVKVNWKETYDDFSVTVSGNMLEGGNKTRIKGKFRSSFGYKGTFEIFK